MTFMVAGSTTFILLTGWMSLRYGDFALGGVRMISEALSLV